MFSIKIYLNSTVIQISSENTKYSSSESKKISLTIKKKKTILSFFHWPLYCLFLFDFRILISSTKSTSYCYTSNISSGFSFYFHCSQYHVKINQRVYNNVSLVKRT